MTKPTIVTVDDDPVVRSLMRATLERDGFTVIEARDGWRLAAFTRSITPICSWSIS